MQTWFEIRDNPTSLVPKLGIWEIHTEDGTDFFTVPAEEDFYRSRRTAALSNILRLSEAQVCLAEMNEATIPESIREYVVGAGTLCKAVLVACDGSFCPNTYTWGVGLVFLKSGECFARGGGCKSCEDFYIGPNFNRVHVRSSSIELLALHSGLQTGTRDCVAVGLFCRAAR